MRTVQHPITSYKRREAAQKLADTMKDDPDLVAKIVERRDGRFVVALHDKADDAFIGCL